MRSEAWSRRNRPTRASTVGASLSLWRASRGPDPPALTSARMAAARSLASFSEISPTRPRVALRSRPRAGS